MKITKDRIIFLIIVSVVVIVLSTATTYATSYLFNSNEVSYNNNSSGIASDNVQGAIDELYEEATTYSQLNTRVSALETKTGTSTLNTTAKDLSGAVNELNSNKSKKIRRATYTWTMNSNLLLDMGVDWSNQYYFISGYAISNVNALISAIVTCQQNRYIRVVGMTNSGGNGQSWTLVYYYIEKNYVE